MPRAFLFKKKRKVHGSPILDDNVATGKVTADSSTHVAPPLTLGKASGRQSLRGDVINIPSYPPPALNKIQVDQKCDEKSAMSSWDQAQSEDTKINRVKGVRNHAHARNIATPLFVNTSNIFDFDSVFARPSGNLSGNWSRMNPAADREHKHTNDSRLREYLESSKRSRTEDGDAIVAVENPWMDTGKFYRPFASSVIPSHIPTRSPPASADITTKPREDESPVPPLKKNTERPQGTTKIPTGKRSADDPSTAFFQSYFHPGSYYRSLYFRHLKAWYDAQRPTSNATDSEVKDPHSTSGNCGIAFRSMFRDYQPGLFGIPPHMPEDVVKEPKAGLNFFDGVLRKNGARQPVPGVEYVQNDSKMTQGASGWRNKSKEGRRLSRDDNQSGSSLDGIISSSSAGDHSRLTMTTGSRAISENVSQIDRNGYNGAMLKTILVAPAPPYRGGRRNTSGKPPQPRKYVCDVCGKAFSRSNTLVTHKRIHTGDKPFACEICGRAFRQPGNLTRHRLTHTTVKPYVCTQCGKAFNRASNLHTHMRNHTNYKPFMCEFCGKGFHQKIDMKIHSYTHTGEKPHKCGTCGRGFKQLTHLTYHMRTHSEVKMYSCNYCGKGFNQKGNLQAHIYRHTGERPHQCTICNKGFTLASTLNTHRKTHEERNMLAGVQCGEGSRRDSVISRHPIEATHHFSSIERLLQK